MVDIQYETQKSLALGTLGAQGLLIAASKLDASREQGFRMATMNYHAQIADGTSGEGPFLYGIACNVPSAAKIAAILAADPQASFSDDARESKLAFVKILGVLEVIDSGGRSKDRDPSSWKSAGKINWSIPEGSEMLYWIMNLHDVALTTGAQFVIAAEWMGVWLSD